MSIARLSGTDLGTREVRYGPRDVSLYALAVGARADQLDLVYERDMRVLPTFAAALGTWATSVAAKRGGYDESKVLHVGQVLELRRSLPTQASIEMSARIAKVFDKGSAALIEIVVESAFFRAIYRMFVPGEGGWGGDRGPSSGHEQLTDPQWSTRTMVAANAAALYRLTGDSHPVHIDPEVAHRTGLRAPIVHGLYTLGVVAREIAAAADGHPCDLARIEATFRSPVYPGDTLAIATSESAHGAVRFEARVGDEVVLCGPEARFSAAASEGR